ncbi:hypothetical protein [Bacillus sp. MUM 13]|uniref:hypothetical protein n=1 Tax=Bacillus sp. MUM 13 TaxID=1678001 RepID=UPI0008F56DCE|nr:hypothetical protein [Bacillus sp. MUM 13]OIK11611.1 hypothetical protein BIV59_11250 [Bacillus sp. MUM 13]
MISLSSVNELETANDALQSFKMQSPAFFEKLLHVVSLTRALHFKYQYMGSLIVDGEKTVSSPEFVRPSVIQLYQNEVQQLKKDAEFQTLKEIFTRYQTIGFAKLSLLILGNKPESLSGAVVIK